MNKFKEMVVGDLTDEEIFKEMVQAILAEDPKTIIILGISDDGEGMLAHTPLESRFHTIGAIESMKHWLFQTGLDTGEMD